MTSFISTSRYHLVFAAAFQRKPHGRIFTKNFVAGYVNTEKQCWKITPWPINDGQPFRSTCVFSARRLRLFSHFSFRYEEPNRLGEKSHRVLIQNTGSADCSRDVFGKPISLCFAPNSSSLCRNIGFLLVPGHCIYYIISRCSGFVNSKFYEKQAFFKTCRNLSEKIFTFFAKTSWQTGKDSV